jgi:hypothetical protein
MNCKTATGWKSIVCVSISLLCFMPHCLAGEGDSEQAKPESFKQESELPTTITVDGDTYENVKWKRVTPATVTIFHKTGVSTIPLASLPPTLQQRFGYDPQKAAEYQAAEDARVAEVQSQVQSHRQLGDVWHAVDARDWEATWTRRDSSNVFDVVRKHKYSSAHNVYVATVTVSGNRVQATATIDGNPHVYEGTLSGDRRHITGTFDFVGRTAVHTWEVTIEDTPQNTANVYGATDTRQNEQETLDRKSPANAAHVLCARGNWEVATVNQQGSRSLRDGVNYPVVGTDDAGMLLIGVPSSYGTSTCFYGGNRHWAWVNGLRVVDGGEYSTLTIKGVKVKSWLDWHPPAPSTSTMVGVKGGSAANYEITLVSPTTIGQCYAALQLSDQNGTVLGTTVRIVGTLEANTPKTITLIHDAGTSNEPASADQFQVAFYFFSGGREIPVDKAENGFGKTNMRRDPAWDK